MTPLTKDKLAKRWVTIAALGIIVIVALEGFALYQGINGSALTTSLAAIAALGGTGIGKLLK